MITTYRTRPHLSAFNVVVGVSLAFGTGVLFVVATLYMARGSA